MKSYKIKKATWSNKKKLIEIEIAKGQLSLPFAKLMTPPTRGNPIEKLYVDKELASKAITYCLKDGTLDSVPLDAFLDFNKDPDYLRESEMHRLSILANKLVKDTGISKREICRRMGTSMSQLSRLLDTSNYSKTFDQLIKLFNILGTEVKIEVSEVA